MRILRPYPKESSPMPPQPQERRSTLLAPRGGFIVPGGRFREIYYWDTYWVVLGLLSVGMRESAMAMCNVLLDQVAEFGFVPNGARSYYLNRSQPPLLTQMIAAVIGIGDVPKGLVGSGDAQYFARASGCGLAEGSPSECGRVSSSGASQHGDDGLASFPDAGTPRFRAWRCAVLRRALPLLDAEYRWWMREGEHASAVRLSDDEGGAVGGDEQSDRVGAAGVRGVPRKFAVLNRYAVSASGPRPESWREDVASAKGCEGATKRALYGELAAGAESGWDYSSRWAVHPTDSSQFRLNRIRTSEVVPVELNAILYANEVTLARMHSLLADDLRSVPSDEMGLEGFCLLAPTRTRHPLMTPHCYGTRDYEKLLKLCPLDPAGAKFFDADAPSDIGSSSAASAAAAADRSSLSYSNAAAARRSAMHEWMWGPWTVGSSCEVSHKDECPGVVSGMERLAGASGCVEHGACAQSAADRIVGHWHDLDLRRGGARIRGVNAASFTPLWAGAQVDAAQVAAAVAALKESGLVQQGGIATTLERTGQQWDWPNGWPPLQQMLISGLVRSGDAAGEKLASELAAAWLRSNYAGWRRSGVMHEKYDVTNPGERGGGGEYEPQVGFGWTNGVILWLLSEFGGSSIEAMEEEGS